LPEIRRTPARSTFTENIFLGFGKTHSRYRYKRAISPWPYYHFHTKIKRKDDSGKHGCPNRFLEEQ
jgi:hypothetical protein